MAVSRKKVLWVDDEIEFLRAHILFLETRGYSVLPVFSGDDAVELIKNNPDAYDIVLLDEQMPGKDGLTTLEEIKEIAPSMPVVMVTKSEEEELMEAALGRKIDGYLTKPVNPSQVLLVCKRLLDCNELISNQLKQKFLRAYTDIRSVLASTLKISDYFRLYESLCRWNVELDKIEDEGLRQMHAGQISDCNTQFCNYVAEQYPRWIRGEGNGPLMATNVIEKVIAPMIENKEKVLMIVLSGMRMDQLLNLETELRTMFRIEKTSFCSVIPSEMKSSRSALFTGKSPEQVYSDCPEIYRAEDEHIISESGKKLLCSGLKNLPISEEQIFYEEMTKNYSQEEITEIIEQIENASIAVITIDIIKRFIQLSSSPNVLKEIASDEKALRSFTSSWFNSSSILKLLRTLSVENRNVIITSDHGHILCSRGTEIYGTDLIEANLRYICGEKISADERQVIFLEEPSHYGLPKLSENSRTIIARENYYFIYPDEFERFRDQYQNSFQCGGISMDEMIMPLYVCKKRSHSGD